MMSNACMHFENDSFFVFLCIHSIPLSTIRFGYFLCEHKSLLNSAEPRIIGHHWRTIQSDISTSDDEM